MPPRRRYQRPRHSLKSKKAAARVIWRAFKAYKLRNLGLVRRAVVRPRALLARQVGYKPRIRLYRKRFNVGQYERFKNRVWLQGYRRYR